MKKLLPFLLLPALALLAPALHAQCGPSTPAFTQASRTFTATTAGESDVAAAIAAEQASPQNGDVIAIPSGTCTFTAVPPTITTSVSFTIQGQTTISTNCAAPPTFNTACTATDNTKLTDGRSGTNLASYFTISMTGSASQVVRITGISFVFPTTAFAVNGEIHVNGNTTGQQARFDHLDLISANVDLSALIFEFGVYGVADHNIFNAVNELNNGVSVNSGGDGSVPWNSTTPRGTGNNFFLENNTFLAGYANDCKKGGTFVSRYNFMTTAGTNSAVAQSHATGSDPSGSPNPQGRGCRAWEVYNNYLVGTNPSGSFSASFNTSGTGVQFGNNVNNYNNDVTLVDDRAAGGSSCGGTSTYCQTNPPTGWGYCGSTFNGTASGWDGNTPSSALGYPCIDQIGRGKGDLLSGVFNSVCNITLNPACNIFTGQWPNQALEPVYVWMETTSLTSGGNVINAGGGDNPNGNLGANRDYYGPNAACAPNGCSSLATGTGYGTLVQRPTTCSAGPSVKIPSGGNLPGVGYWATDTQTLYSCYPANTWNTWYTPYTYPHPLVSGAGGTVTLSPSSESFGMFNVSSSSSPVTFTLTNSSSTTATSISISDTDSAEFPITNSGAGSCAAAGGSLAASASCTFTVKFGPTSAGVKNPTLSVSYSGGDGASPQTASLSGTGVSVTAPAAAIMAMLR
jgi:hypothetical protein